MTCFEIGIWMTPNKTHCIIFSLFYATLAWANILSNILQNKIVFWHLIDRNFSIFITTLKDHPFNPSAKHCPVSSNPLTGLFSFCYLKLVNMRSFLITMASSFEHNMRLFPRELWNVNCTKTCYFCFEIRKIDPHLLPALLFRPHYRYFRNQRIVRTTFEY